MNSVKIQLTRESKIQKLDFLTWKDDRRSFYAKLINGNDQVISLTPALPKTPAWGGNPFPQKSPIEIKPFTLLPPITLSSSAAQKAAQKTIKERNELLDSLEKLNLLDAPQDHDDSIRGNIDFQKYLVRCKPFPAHQYCDSTMKKKWPDGLRDEIWWMLTGVTHKIEFEDGQNAYLCGIDIRKFLQPAELREINLIRSSQNQSHTKKPNKIDEVLGRKIIMDAGALVGFNDLSDIQIEVFNLLRTENPDRPGYMLPYKEIGKRVGKSKETVRRIRLAIESTDNLASFIIEARAKNDGKVAPEALDPSHSVDNDPENSVSM
jgi:hypothetical protein